MVSDINREKKHETDLGGPQAVRGSRGGVEEGQEPFQEQAELWDPPLPPADGDVKARVAKGLSKAYRCELHFVLFIFHMQVPSFCSDADDIDCRLEDLTKKYCLEYNYEYENGFAIGN